MATISTGGAMAAAGTPARPSDEVSCKRRCPTRAGCRSRPQMHDMRVFGPGPFQRHLRRGFVRGGEALPGGGESYRLATVEPAFGESCPPIRLTAAGMPYFRGLLAFAPLPGHATARNRQAGTSLISQAAHSRQPVREPAHRTLWTLRPQPQLLHRSCNKAGMRLSLEPKGDHTA
jgi:hypothetical protein